MLIRKFKSKNVVRCSFNRFNCLSNRAHGGSPGASADQTALLSFSSLPGQTVAKLFGALFVVLDALIFVYVRSSFFDVVFQK